MTSTGEVLLHGYANKFVVAPFRTISRYFEKKSALGDSRIYSSLTMMWFLMKWLCKISYLCLTLTIFLWVSPSFSPSLKIISSSSTVFDGVKNLYQKSIFEDYDRLFLEENNRQEEVQYDSEVESEDDGWPVTENHWCPFRIYHIITSFVRYCWIYDRSGLSEFISNLSVCYAHRSCGAWDDHEARVERWSISILTGRMVLRFIRSKATILVQEWCVEVKDKGGLCVQRRYTSPHQNPKSLSWRHSKFNLPLTNCDFAAFCDWQPPYRTSYIQTARRRPQRDHPCVYDHSIQKCKIDQTHMILSHDDNRLSESPECSIITWIPIASTVDDFYYAQFRRLECVWTKIGHDILQTTSTSEETLDLVVGPPQVGGVLPMYGPNSRHGLDCRESGNFSLCLFSPYSVVSICSWRWQSKFHKHRPRKLPRTPFRSTIKNQ